MVLCLKEANFEHNFDGKKIFKTEGYRGKM